MRTYRASSLGYSLEALVAPHLGFEPVDPPEFLQVAFEEGNRLEPLIIAKMQETGWEIDSEQNEVEFEVIPDKVKVVGHIDGIVRKIDVIPFTTIPAILEIKTMAAKSWEGFNRHGWDTPGLVQKYKWQASAYMLAAGLPHIMVGWNKDTEEFAYAVAMEPFYSISDIANKLQLAENAIAAGVVPDGCEDFPCGFYYLHPPKDEVAKADQELEDQLAAWLVYDKEIKKLEKTRDLIRKGILQLAGDNLAAKVKGECGVTVETYWQNESEYVTKRKEGWVSRISGPRKGKSEDRG